MKLLSDLPNNSRYAIMFEPAWMIFASMISFYAPLYMKGIGLTEIQMGLVTSTGLFFSFIFLFIGAPITNRLGRKKTTFIFDVMSCSIPALIWAVSQNFWYFVVAASINASVKVVSVSWNCLITEDAEQSKRSKVFGTLYVMNYAAGIITPITGLIISKYGTVPTMRVMYFLWFLSATTMFYIRNKFLTETSVGKELMTKHSELSILQSLRSYTKSIPNLFKKRNYLLITLIYIITNFIISTSFYQIIYLTKYLGYSEKNVALMPGISAALNIMLYIFIVPKLKKYVEKKILAGALAISVVGTFLFLLVPPKNLPFLFLALGFMAIGNFLTLTYRDSVFINHLGEHEKADVYSTVQTIAILVCIPSGYIAGLTYSMNPVIPFIMIFALFICALLITCLLIFLTKKTDAQNATLEM